MNKMKTLEQVLLHIQKKNPTCLITLRHADKIYYVDTKETRIYDTVIFYNKIINHTLNTIQQKGIALTPVFNISENKKQTDIVIISNKTIIQKD